MAARVKVLHFTSGDIAEASQALRLGGWLGFFRERADYFLGQLGHWVDGHRFYREWEGYFLGQLL